MIKKYDITQCVLYKCSNKKRLERFLLLEPGELKHITEDIKYHSFSIPKKDGTEREITAPNFKLKKIQKRIFILLSRVIKPDWLISSQKGKSYIDNGRAHQDSKYCLTMDVKSFYPNCSREYVYQFFINKLKTSPDVANVLTDIVTYDQQVPTGCPTSQIIAYYAYEDMFEQINCIAKEHSCIFTLYVDDMTFSGYQPFDPHKLRDTVHSVLRKYGHKIKESKTKYYSSKDFKLITGVVVTPDNKLKTSNNLQNKIIRNFNEAKKNNFNNDKDMQSLRGQIQAARTVDKSIFPEINRIVNKKIFELLY